MSAARYRPYASWREPLPHPRSPLRHVKSRSRADQPRPGSQGRPFAWPVAAAGSLLLAARKVRASGRAAPERPMSRSILRATDTDKREAEIAAKDTRERRGRRGEDIIIAARERGLREVELIFGLVAGPLAAAAYPWLRETSADLITGEQKLCWDWMGLCGSVPEALQVFFRSTAGLLFSFLLGYTSSFLLVRQEKFYEAMYEESSVLTQLLEEAPLLLKPPEQLSFVKLMKLYLASSTWRNASYIPSELVARTLRSDKDPVEAMTRLLVGLSGSGPERMLANITSLRNARARKYSSMQRIIPTSQFGVLVFLALLITLSPFLDGHRDSSQLASVLYGVLVEVLIFVIVYVGGGPGLGIYTTDRERATILEALMGVVDRIEADATAKEEAPDVVKVKQSA